MFILVKLAIIILKIAKTNFKITLNLKFYLYFKHIIRAINSFYFKVKVKGNKKAYKA